MAVAGGVAVGVGAVVANGGDAPSLASGTEPWPCTCVLLLLPFPLLLLLLPSMWTMETTVTATATAGAGAGAGAGADEVAVALDACPSSLPPACREVARASACPCACPCPCACVPSVCCFSARGVATGEVSGLTTTDEEAVPVTVPVPLALAVEATEPLLDGLTVRKAAWGVGVGMGMGTGMNCTGRHRHHAHAQTTRQGPSRYAVMMYLKGVPWAWSLAMIR